MINAIKTGFSKVIEQIILWSFATLGLSMLFVLNKFLTPLIKEYTTMILYIFFAIIFLLYFVVLILNFKIRSLKKTINNALENNNITHQKAISDCEKIKKLFRIIGNFAFLYGHRHCKKCYLLLLETNPPNAPMIKTPGYIERPRKAFECNNAECSEFQKPFWE